MAKALIKTKQFKIDELVKYSKASIVSQEIVKKSSGTVTVFAFDSNQGLSEHTAPFDAMVTIIDGSVTITIAGKPFNLKKGETIIMPAGRPHALQSKTRFKMLLTMIKSQ